MWAEELAEAKVTAARVESSVIGLELAEELLEGFISLESRSLIAAAIARVSMEMEVNERVEDFDEPGVVQMLVLKRPDESGHSVVKSRRRKIMVPDE